MSSPVEALQIAMDAGILRHMPPRYRRPGEVIERWLSPSIREALKKLTSDDVLKMRFEPKIIMDEEWEDQDRYRKLLLEFDREVLHLG